MPFPVSRRAALPALALATAWSTASAQACVEPVHASILVTATRSPQAASEVLSDHLIISADDIARSGAGSVVDLLQQQRAIEVARNGGPGTASSVFIRGADSKQNVVLVDGVRIGSSTTGAANWSALPLANIDRIEVVYGPLATTYGADAIGGVVQLFTKRGTGAPRVSAAAGAGSNAARRAELGVAGASGGPHSVSYALFGARERERGFSATKPGNFSYNPDNDGYNRDSTSGQLVFAPAQGHELGLLFLHSRLDAQYDAGASLYDARTLQDVGTTALFSAHRISAAWRMRLQAAQADDKSATDSSASVSGKSRIQTRQRSFSWQNDIAVGRDLLQVVFERRDEDVVSSSTPALTTGRNTDSLAASYSLRRGSHIAAASARNDDSSQYGSTATGALAYGYRIAPALRIDASAGTSFRAPTFNELYFPGYGVASNKPEHGRNVEAGLHFDDGKMKASAIFFRNRITDLLVTSTRCPVELDTHSSGCAYNVNRATILGLSLAASARWGDLTLRSSLDVQDPRDDTSGKALARRARRHASFAVDYSFGALDTGAALQLSGKRYDDAANRNALGGYGLLTLSGSYRFAPDWSVFLNWNNATDKQYELARNYATAGSQVFAGLRYGAK